MGKLNNLHKSFNIEHDRAKILTHLFFSLSFNIKISANSQIPQYTWKAERYQVNVHLNSEISICSE